MPKDSTSPRTGRPRKGKRAVTHPYLAEHPGCPLSYHPGSKSFYKTHKGRRYYFGPEPIEAVRRFEREWSYIVTGQPIPSDDGSNVGRLVNAWLEDRLKDAKAGRIKMRTWRQYKEVGAFIVEQAGRQTPVAAMTPARFTDLHRALERRWGSSPTVLARCVTISRMPFKWGFDSGEIEAVRFGPRFKPPSKADRRVARHGRGRQTFTADEVRAMLDAASPTMKAAILIGVNGAYTQQEVAELRTAWVDLDAGVIDHLRGKTKFARRVPLWVETIEAIRALPVHKPKPEARGLLFVTRGGKPYTAERGDNGIGQTFGRLMTRCGIELQQTGFGKLRATHRTISDGAKDPNAARLIMGHQIGQGVEEHYIRSIDDDRLRAVSEYVRSWLFPEPIKPARRSRR